MSIVQSPFYLFFLGILIIGILIIVFMVGKTHGKSKKPLWIVTGIVSAVVLGTAALIEIHMALAQSPFWMFIAILIGVLVIVFMVGKTHGKSKKPLWIVTGIVVVIVLGTAVLVKIAASRPIESYSYDNDEVVWEDMSEIEEWYDSIEIDNLNNSVEQPVYELTDNNQVQQGRSSSERSKGSSSSSSQKELSDDELYSAFMDGMIAETDGDYEKAFNIYSELGIKQGHIMSMSRIGYMYENGLGVKKDVEKAIQIYKLLDGQEPEAMTRLGNIYSNYGENNEEYQKKAASLWLRAAKMGYKYAQLNIGVAYFMGEGIEQNFEEGRKWLKKAADQGVKKAKDLLEDIDSLN